MKIYILLIALLFIGFAFTDDNSRDVCVLGGGASGMAAAVFLKDKGYNVLVIEKKNRVGGNCHSFPLNPPPPGGRSWIDSGVSAILNTTFLEQNGVSEIIQTLLKDKYVEYNNGAKNINLENMLKDTTFLRKVGVTDKNILDIKKVMVVSKKLGKTTGYAVNSAAFARRFTSEPLLDFNIDPYPTYAADFETKSIFPGPFPTIIPTPDFINAFIEYSILLYYYPWLNQGDYPDPIPAELAQPFDQFVAQFNLTALSGLFRLYLTNYRGVPWSQYSALSAVSDIGQWVLQLQSNPQAGFIVNKGCSEIYTGMRNYLGRRNVWLNMDVTNVVRPSSGNEVVLVMKNNDDRSDQVVTCGKLIVSFPALTDNLDAFKLSTAERNLFKDISAFNIYPFIVNASLTSDHTPYSCVMNINNTDSFLYPSAPYVSQMCRFGSTSGPSQSWLVTSNVIGMKKAIDLIDDQLSGLQQLFSFEEDDLLDLKFHFYAPHFSVSALQQSPNPYTKLSQLQGQLNTYWIGASWVPDWTHINWNRAKRIVDQFFPPLQKSQQ